MIIPLYSFVYIPLRTNRVPNRQLKSPLFSSKPDLNLSMEEKDYTLIFLRRTELNGQKRILLGMKKRGFGVGKWNGFGGKLEPDETIEQCAIRELEEESMVKALSVNRRGYLVFKMLDTSKLMRVHVYESYDFCGEAKETDEMRPQWFNEENIPLQSMWPDDTHWMPYFLGGKSFVGR